MKDRTMTENEAIKEVRFNMSRIGLNDKSAKRVSEAKNMAIQALEEVQKYRAIGTPEECRSAVEKQTAKKPSQDSLDGLHYFPTCPSCGYGLDEEDRESYCECGQKLDWSDVE